MAIALAMGAALLAASPADAAQTARTPAANSLSGASTSIGVPFLEGARLAADEANAAGDGFCCKV